MRSKRITQIEGTFMGVDFYVKPTPINVDEVDEKKRNMLLDWYKKNHTSLHEKLVSSASIDDYTQDDVIALNEWKKDIEFRSQYLKFVAESCMQFAKPIGDNVWESDSIELSTIMEAWDFFTERRLVPLSGVQTR